MVQRAEALLLEGRKILAELGGPRPEVRENSIGDDGAGFSDVVNGLMMQNIAGGFGTIDTQALPFGLANANSYGNITLNRVLLSYSYKSQGLIRTAVDQPIDDAFRGGIKFRSAELSDEELAELNRAFKRKRQKTRNRKTGLRVPGVDETPLSQVNWQVGYPLANSDLEACKDVARWARLFGGAGLLVNTDQKASKNLDPERIREDSPLSFIAADRWELSLSAVNLYDPTIETPFNYYGYPVHKTRVVTMLGDKAPSFLRLQLQGWGLSFLERCLRPMNAFIKFERVMFELMDEAKTDIYRVKGFNASLATAAGTALIQKRAALVNQMKNYQTAVTMDVADEYEQKTLGDLFSGLSKLWEQLRINLCAYLRMPMNKLFGTSASGFGSGKDSMDVYNGDVGNLREQAEPIVLVAGELRCQQLFGMIPEDLEVEWAPLSVLDGVEEETVKTSKQNRIVQRYQSGLTTAPEALDEMRREQLMSCDETEVEQGIRDAEPPLSENPGEVAAGRDHEMAMAKQKTADAAKKQKANSRQVGRK